MLLNILLLLILFIVAVSICKHAAAKHGKVYQRMLIFLCIYHFAISLVFYFFMLDDPGNDSMRFWRTAEKINSAEAWEFMLSGRSTYFMFAIVFPLSKMGLSYFSATMLFSLLGFVAIKIFFELTKENVPTNSKFLGLQLFPWLFFLPNLHFWSSGLGKDTLVLLGIALFTLGVSKLNSKWLYITLGLAITVLVRPHITLMLLVSTGLVVLFGSSVKLYYKIPIGLIIATGAIIVLPKVLEISGMEEASVAQYSEFSATKTEQLSRSHTSSAIDISSYPFPLKVFSFLFRPTFIDINGIPALVAAFENLLLLLLTLKVFLTKPVRSLFHAPPLAKFLILFLGLGTVLFSLTLSNLGIMLRMRNMFLPGLIFYLLWVMSYLRLSEAGIKIIK